MNRFIVCTKRILSKRMYLILILLMLVMTAIYKVLPSKSKTTDIKVALYIEDTSSYATALQQELEEAATLYTFYYTQSTDELIHDVQSGYAECGYVFPEGFFQSYRSGTGCDKAILYETPSTTLSATISESLFHYIFKVTAPDILIDIAGYPEYEQELKDGMLTYMSGDDVFHMSSATEGEFNFRDMEYHVELPVKEFACLFTLFAALFGLLLHMQDKERKIYLALSKGETFQIQTTLILAAMLPIVITGILTNLIAYGTDTLPSLCVVALGSFLFSTFLSVVIKKSSWLTKILPIFLFVAIAYFFITSLI